MKNLRIASLTTLIAVLIALGILLKWQSSKPKSPKPAVSPTSFIQKSEDVKKDNLDLYLENMARITREEWSILEDNFFVLDSPDDLGDKTLAQGIYKGKKDLITLQAELERMQPPEGYEQFHQYSVKAIQIDIEAFRLLEDGIYYSDVSKLHQALEKEDEAADYRSLSTDLLPK